MKKTLKEKMKTQRKTVRRLYKRLREAESERITAMNETDRIRVLAMKILSELARKDSSSPLLRLWTEKNGITESGA